MVKGMTIKELYEWASSKEIENYELVFDYSEDYEWAIAEEELSIDDGHEEIRVLMDYEEC